MWTNSTVACLLKNRNCIGWMRINGFEFDQYFPAIISDKIFREAQSKLAFNVRNRGGSKYGFVRNLFKGLLKCAVCGQAIETKIGQYKTVQGTLNHYADYICRGVKHKNGCTNQGRASVCEFEAILFQSILNLNDFTKPTPRNTEALDELENELARIEIRIGRCVELLDNDELTNMKELSAKLAQLNRAKGQFIKKIEVEKSKSTAVSNAPQVIKALHDIFEANGVTVVKLPSDPKAEMKKLFEAEFTRIKKHLKSIEERRRLRNMMPSVFEGIKLRFGNEVKAYCQFVDGRSVSLTITNGVGLVRSISFG
jgi:hypothetical protein